MVRQSIAGTRIQKYSYSCHGSNSRCHFPSIGRQQHLPQQLLASFSLQKKAITNYLGVEAVASLLKQKDTQDKQSHKDKPLNQLYDLIADRPSA